jgi:hypothetical protein
MVSKPFIIGDDVYACMRVCVYACMPRALLVCVCVCVCVCVYACMPRALLEGL